VDFRAAAAEISHSRRGDFQARFQLHLWLEDMLAPTPTETDFIGSAASPLKILVVEDNDLIREVLLLMLAGDEHVCRAACNAGEAETLVASEYFDLVITDHEMPGMKGRELALEVKRLSPSTKVILLTANAPKYRAAAASEGIDHVAAKPCDLPTLREAIAAVCPTCSPSTAL